MVKIATQGEILCANEKLSLLDGQPNASELTEVIGAGAPDLKKAFFRLTNNKTSPKN